VRRGGGREGSKGDRGGGNEGRETGLEMPERPTRKDKSSVRGGRVLESCAKSQQRKKKRRARDMRRKILTRSCSWCHKGGDY
jgi:hypothetical protein